MGIYIKGMEMPKVPTRFIIFDDGRVEDEDDSAYKYSAVPVPPHGELIDRDKFRETMFIGEQCLYSWDEIEDAIDYAPTIIPASEEGE